MRSIDSYCEKILASKTTGTVSVLPGGVSREEYVWKLDVLISDMFAVLTDYSEMDFRRGYVLLLLLKKYCLSKKALSNAPQEKDFSDYLIKTEKMLNDEIFRLNSNQEGIYPVVDADKAFTIIANIMQLITSVIIVQNRDKEKMNAQVLGISLPIKVDKQEKICLAREDTAISDIIPYLDAVYDITGSFERAKKNAGASKVSYVQWIEFKYLKMVLELTKCKLDEIGVF